MRKLIFGIVIISVISIISCQTPINDVQGIGYTEYINSKELEKEIVDQYPSGQEKAVVYRDKDDVEQKPVKEVHFFEDGQVQVEGTLKNGERHGIWTFYHDNGKIWSTGEFVNGKSEGVFEIYNKKGIIQFRYLYKNNKIVKEEYFVDGKLNKTVDKSKAQNDPEK